MPGGIRIGSLGWWLGRGVNRVGVCCGLRKALGRNRVHLRNPVVINVESKETTPLMSPEPFLTVSEVRMRVRQ